MTKKDNNNKKNNKKSRSKIEDCRVIDRRYLGLWMAGASNNSPPIAHAIYEDTLEVVRSETTEILTRVSLGSTIQVVEHPGMRSSSKKHKKWHLAAYRPDLFYSIQAASTLFQQIEQACLQLDIQRLQRRRVRE